MKQFLQRSFSGLKLSVWLAGLVLVLLPQIGWGQIAEGFESSSTPPAGWVYNSLTHGTNNARTGSRCLTFNGAGDAAITPLITTPDQLSFWYRRSSNTTGWSLIIQVLDASNNVIVNLNPASGATDIYRQYTADLSSYTNIKVKLTDGRSSGAHERYIDDFSVTEKLTGPTISAPTLTGTSPYCEGSSFNVSYSTSGTFNAGNTFTAQLSDASGSFASATSIGTGSSPLAVTLPTGVFGSGYKIRMVSSDPVVEGDATNAFEILPASNPVSLSSTGNQSVTINGTGSTLAATAYSGSAFTWKYSSLSSGPFNTQVATGSSYEITGSDFSSTGTYYLIAEAATSCGVSQSAPIEISVTNPQPVLSVGSLAPFATPVNVQSVEQAYTIAGSALNSPVTITPPANFLLSQTSGSGYTAAPFTLMPVNGEINETIYVVYTPATAGLHSGFIQHTSAEISQQNVPVEGNSIADLTFTGSFVNVLDQIVTTPSPAQSFTVNGVNLTGNVEITAPSHFEVSQTSSTSGFSNSITLNITNGNVSGNIWIRYLPTLIGTHAGTVNVVATNDGLSQIIAVEGNAIAIPIPVAGVLLLEDNFEGTAGDDLTANGWAAHSGAGTNPIKFNNADFGVNQYGSSLIGNSIALTGNGEDINRGFDVINSGTAYAAFISKVGNAATAGDYFFHFVDANTSTSSYKARVFVRQSSNSGYVNFGIANAGSQTVAEWSTDYAINTEHLIVVRYDFSAGSHSSRLYINPNPLYEASNYYIEASDAGTPNPNVGGVAFRQGNNGYLIELDGLRVGTGWGAVLGNPTYTDPASAINPGNYHNLTVNTAGGEVTLNGPVKVHGTLAMDQGKIISTATNLLTISATGTVIAPEVTSYVDGPLAYKITGAKLLTFPIGKGANARPIELNILSQGAGENTYTAEQFDVAYAPQDTAMPTGVSHISKIRYFNIAKSGSAPVSANVKLTYAADDLVAEPGKLTIVKYSDGVPENLQAIASGTATAGTIISDNFTTFSDFMLANLKGGINPLPVELLSFTAKTIENATVLTWETASEQNSSHFEVQHSANAHAFETLGSVQAAGNSQTLKRYAFHDKNPMNGIIYYRLKQVDTDGTVAYSKIEQVDRRQSGSKMQLFPNPTTGEISLLFPDNVPAKIKVINILGQVVYSQQILETNDLKLNLKHLPAGTYQLMVETENFRSIRKLVKTNN